MRLDRVVHVRRNGVGEVGATRVGGRRGWADTDPGSGLDWRRVGVCDCLEYTGCTCLRRNTLLL